MNPKTAITRHPVHGTIGATPVRPSVHVPHPIEPVHSADFCEVRWLDGHTYRFKPGNQAKAIEVLWEHWEMGMGLHEKKIGERICSGSDRFRLIHAFREKGRTMHPAWNRMIVSDGRGRWRLSPRKRGITE
jgi:hypothetical protein